MIERKIECSVDRRVLDIPRPRVATRREHHPISGLSHHWIFLPDRALRCCGEEPMICARTARYIKRPKGQCRRPQFLERFVISRLGNASATRRNCRRELSGRLRWDSPTCAREPTKGVLSVIDLDDFLPYCCFNEDDSRTAQILLVHEANRSRLIFSPSPTR
jgi:hypothetical protein